MPPQAEPELEDTETEEISRQIAFDEGAYRKTLQENGVPDATIELLLAPLKANAQANARLLARQEKSRSETYRSKLAAEFPLADPEMISGSSPRELRASAERLQRFAEKVIKAAGKGTPAPNGAPNEEEDKAKLEARRAQYGEPPETATETILESPSVPFEEILAKAKSATKPADVDAVIETLKKQGPRVVPKAQMRFGPQPKAQA